MKLLALDWLDELLIPDVSAHRFHRLTTCVRCAPSVASARPTSARCRAFSAPPPVHPQPLHVRRPRGAVRAPGLGCMRILCDRQLWFDL